MISNTSILQLQPDVTWQDMGENEPAVILQLTTGQLFTCNLTTRRFLELMDGRRSFFELVDAVHAEFEVERDQLEKDLRALSSRLVEADLIRCG